MSDRNHLRRSSAEVERAVGAVRLILVLIGATLMIGVRTPNSDLRTSIVHAATIVAAGVGLALLPSFLRRWITNDRVNGSIMQTADTLATLGLVHLLGTITPDSAWVLFAIPIVVASLRLGSFGVVLVWVGSTLGYLTLFWLDVHPEGRSALATSLTLERPGILLAVAACVAVLTRWLQEAWADQAIAAQESEQRLNYVATLERAGRELQEVSSADTLQVAIELATDFGFTSVTVPAASGLVLSAGDPTIVPRGQTIELSEDDPAELITWTGDDGSRVYSISIVEPVSGSVVTGWSDRALSEIQIEAFSNMLGLTSMHLELAKMFEGARHAASHDPLTGLANRSELNRQLAKIAGGSDHLALLFLDLDHFKQINDTYGHQIGDEVLVFVADRLTRIVGSFGTVARFGGDEFVIALSRDRAKAAADLARHIHNALDGPTLFGETNVEISTSIGIGRAVGPIHPDELLQVADEAVFLAKDDGRGTTRELRIAPTQDSTRVDDVEAELVSSAAV